MFVALIIKVRIVAHLMDLPCVPSTKKTLLKGKWSNRQKQQQQQQQQNAFEK